MNPPIETHIAKELTVVEQINRGLDFWRRVVKIYSCYKAKQAEALKLKASGISKHDLAKKFWEPHHKWSGQQIYKLCVDLRGFYLKSGQFIGARPDIFPEAMCKELHSLHDQVPPMPGHQVEEILKQELQVDNLSDVFEMIDLDNPIGSASIAQVHRALLADVGKPPSRRAQGWRWLKRKIGKKQLSGHITHVLQEGQAVWQVANRLGVSLEDVQAVNKGINVDHAQPGDEILIPIPQINGIVTQQLADPNMRSNDQNSACEADCTDGGCSEGKSGADDGVAMPGATGGWFSKFRGENGSNESSSSSSIGDDNLGVENMELITPSAVSSVQRSIEAGLVGRDREVAVKVQYPGAQEMMKRDLRNLSVLAEFVSRFEIQFDLPSVLAELSKQIQLEFNFEREARVMDTIHGHLAPIRRRVRVPHSIPGLVTRKVLVMKFLQGSRIMDLQEQAERLGQRKQKMIKTLIMTRLSEAYGRMILGRGLFQADGHPGNILVMKRGVVGLLDYGQSKQISGEMKKDFAQMILDLEGSDKAQISKQLSKLGVNTSTDDVNLRAQIATNMFDTVGQIDAFGPDSIIKKTSIDDFPREMFFVLRVVQLLRGLSNAMGLEDFSTVQQWKPMAISALEDE